jgi:hypothetical protein
VTQALPQVVSIVDWVRDGAIKGEQRYFYVENPGFGLLRSVCWSPALPGS